MSKERKEEANGGVYESTEVGEGHVDALSVNPRGNPHVHIRVVARHQQELWIVLLFQLQEVTHAQWRLHLWQMDFPAKELRYELLLRVRRKEENHINVQPVQRLRARLRELDGPTELAVRVESGFFFGL